MVARGTDVPVDAAHHGLLMLEAVSNLLSSPRAKRHAAAPRLPGRDAQADQLRARFIAGESLADAVAAARAVEAAAC
jgi:hypothetical protein